MTKKILIDSADKIKGFVSAMYDCPFKAELISGNHRVSASSIMGIFSLDLEKPVDLKIHCDDLRSAERIFDSVRAYLAA